MKDGRHWKHLKKGDASQFIDSKGDVRACVIKHVYANGHELRIDYFRDGLVVCDAHIHGSDIVRDEDVATRNL